MDSYSKDFNTSKDRFFRQYLELIKVFSPYNKLRPQALDVLAELMKYNNVYANVPYEDRWKLIMHYDTKTKMKESLNMKDAGFNNILSDLRDEEVGLLVDNKIPEEYLFTIDDKFEFKLNFNISDADK